MRFEVVGINVITKNEKRYFVLHCVSQEITGRDNFTGKRVESFFINDKLMPVGIKVGSFVIPQYDVSGGKAYLQGFELCK